MDSIKEIIEIIKICSSDLISSGYDVSSINVMSSGDVCVTFKNIK